MSCTWAASERLSDLLSCGGAAVATAQGWSVGEGRTTARAASAGVHDYLLEGSTGRQIVDTIRDAASDKPPSAFSRYGKILASMKDRSSHPAVDLTPRELQILRHVG
jgi:DNA-binding NarL/FixJ family response regulator